MSPPEIVAVIGGCLAILGVLWRLLAKAFRAFSRLERTVNAVESRSVQLMPNGGTSLADTVRRMEVTFGNIREDVVQLRERMACVETTANTASDHARDTRHALDALALVLPHNRRHNDGS